VCSSQVVDDHVPSRRGQRQTGENKANRALLWNAGCGKNAYPNNMSYVSRCVHVVR